MTEKPEAILFDMDGVTLEFDHEALRAMARKAIDKGTGARGLRAILEAVMIEIMFDIPSDKTIKKCVITKDVVEKGTAPKLLKKTKAKKSKPKKSAS